MTIGDMRRFMLKKVVPEVLVPQNIVDFLIDENSPPPEPDAFTFLTRLRGLGIGSADFLYLLEGCGAPEQAVSKIKAHPAMNLQGLIVTLEESGMTSKDYTRILYTARQIWERTLTLRLETSEQLSEEDGADMNADTVEVAAPAAENNGGASDDEDLTRVSLPHKKEQSPYPDATEELMSVDFGSDPDLEEEPDRTGGETSVSEEAPEYPEADEAVSENEKPRPDNGAGAVGIGIGGAADLFGGSASDGELGYSRQFTESFVNDYMIDFAEDDLGDAPEEDHYDDFGTFYGEVEQSEDNIPAVGSSREDAPAAEEVSEKSDASAGIPDAREPFEVHIASYDIPDIPDEFDAARSENADEAENSEAASDKQDDGVEFVEAEELSELPKKNTAPFEVVIDYGDEEQPAAPVPSPAPAENGGYNGETTRLIPINREAVERSMSELAGKMPASAGSDNSKESAENVKTAVQKPAVKTAKQRPATEAFDENEDEVEEERSGKLSDISKNFGRSDISSDNYVEDEERKPSGVKKGIIIAAGIGAAALVGANFAVSHFIGGNDRSIRYAKSAEEVFADIYYSYNDENDRVMGGEAMFDYADGYTEAFGDMLICGTGLGTVTAGNNVYSVSENKITASVFSGGELDTLGQFEPADGTKFVAAFGSGDSLIAVYNGSGANRSGDCGYLRIKGESVVYTVRQSGKLTDVMFEGNEIKLGSVYTPVFTESFNAERTDIYLPKVGVSDGLTAIPAESVVLSRTKGYTYAISGGYSVEDGAVTVVKAALGDPVYADAEGTFFLNGKEEKGGGEYGLIVSADNSGEEAKSVKCGKIGCAAAFEGGSAVYERGEEGGETVLRDKELNICSSKMRSADIPDRFAFSGSTLIAFSGDSVSFAADCSDINAVKLNNLRLVNGNTDGKSAVTLEPDEKGIKLTRYVLENGEVKPAGTFTRELSADQRNTLACGDKNAMVIGSDRVGAAYSYFDGVSVISEYVTLGTENEAVTLYDDKTGFEYAFEMDGKLRAVCSKGAVDVTSTGSSPDGSERWMSTP